MSLPSPLLAVPTLLPDQMSFQGVTIGHPPYSPFGVTELEGLQKPQVRSGNTDRPRTRGAFVGANFLKTRTITATMDIGPVSGAVAQATNLIPDPSFEYDTVGSAPSSALWSEYTSGSIASNAFAVSSAWSQLGSRSLHVQGTHSADTTLESIGAQSPSNTIAAVAGQTYTLIGTCNVVQGGPGNGIVFVLAWYTSGGLLISTSTSSVLSAGQLGVCADSFTATAPASTAFVQVTVAMQSVVNGGVVEFYVDAIALEATSAAFVYFDGDSLGYEWQGFAGASESVPASGWGKYGIYGNALAGPLRALDTACVTEGALEYPLWIQIPGFPLVCTMARVINKDLKYNVAADLGGIVEGATVQWESTDPYFYSAPTSTTTIGLPTPGVGFTFPLTFNWSFGGGSSANMATIVNAGNVSCWPVLVITGPCLNPSVSNLSVAGNPTLSFDVQLNAGDVLVVDCDMESIVFFAAGAAVGSPAPQVSSPGSSYFACPPGNSVFAFNSQDTSPASGTLTVWSASAYSGLI